MAPVVNNGRFPCLPCLQVCAFANATCGSFVAVTQTGYLQVSVQNTCYIASSYTLEASA